MILLVIRCNLLCLEAVKNCPSWDLPQVQSHQSLAAVNGPGTTSGLLHVAENRFIQDKELIGTITVDAIAFAHLGVQHHNRGPPKII